MRGVRRVARWVLAGFALLFLGYGGWVGIAWASYGRAAPPRDDEGDPLLDRFMPHYEVAERHQVHVDAPPATTLAAAAETDIEQAPVIRAIFRARELVLGADPGAATHPPGLLPETLSMGWGILAETPGREIVVGAVTQPWQANVVFRALPPEAFAAFREPGYVKIAWTLRADPAGPSASVFRTETRVMTTDAAARSKFRWYWARFSPGIVLIRYAALGLVKEDAERLVKKRR